jgi:hypothetical protein
VTARSGAEVVGSATRCEKRRIDPLDIDAAVPNGLNIVRDFDQLAHSGVGCAKGRLAANFKCGPAHFFALSPELDQKADGFNGRTGSGAFIA